MGILGRNFYKRHPAKVARDLLGKLLVRKIGGKTLSGRIVETEAYGSDDPASHSYRGMTGRNRAMFGEAGRAYVYFTYGNHFCLNVVARDREPAGAVLIRAIEPLEGIETMRKYRKLEDIRSLASGPGKLTKALCIDRSFNGVGMTRKGELFITDGKSGAFGIKCTPRTGIRLATRRMWRFLVEGNEFVSR